MLVCTNFGIGIDSATGVWWNASLLWADGNILNDGIYSTGNQVLGLPALQWSEAAIKHAIRVGISQWFYANSNPNLNQNVDPMDIVFVTPCP